MQLYCALTLEGVEIDVERNIMGRWGGGAFMFQSIFGSAVEASCDVPRPALKVSAVRL
jgi:hypothetical protein